MFVRTAIICAEALSDNAMRIMMVVVVMHVECGLPRGAANQDGLAAQILQRVGVRRWVLEMVTTYVERK